MKSFKLYVEVTSASQRLAGNLKRSGFDVNARHDYWTKKAKEIEDKRKEYEKNNPTPVVKEDGEGAIGAAPTNSVAGVAGSISTLASVSPQQLITVISFLRAI